MPMQAVDVMVEGGKATAAPPLGPALGPLGVNIGQVISKINEKTAAFKGMQVPVKVEVETESKEFTISVGTPPTSALIKKEAGVEKGSGNPLAERIADLRIEQIIKVAKMKQDNLMGKDNFARVKEVCGTCDSMGIMVEGKPAKETIKLIDQGSFKDKILAGKTELTVAELKALEEERKRLEEDIKKRRAEFEAKAKEIIKLMEGKPRGQIKTKLVEAGVPTTIIEELLPAEARAAPGAAPGTAPGAAPA
ncbi:50S ribosomal protein L11, partial [Candidatus Woesearchaeota archaeon]|nr:50S ribosomal protein L11 [Candidatus Woesearchaeota archaeon]